MKKPIVATAEQIRRALRLIRGQAPTLKTCGLALLSVMTEDGMKMPPWDTAPDYEAGAIMRTYCHHSVALRAQRPGRRIADQVRFNEHGVVTVSEIG